MKNSILFCLLLVALNGFLPLSALAKCTYTAFKSGNFSDPIWTVTGTPTSNTGVCTSSPTEQDAVIIIDGFDVTLRPGESFTLNSSGSLTILSSPTKTTAGALYVSGSGPTNYTPAVFISYGPINIGDGGQLVAVNGGNIFIFDSILNIGAEGNLTVFDRSSFFSNSTIVLGTGTQPQKVTNLIVYNGGQATANQIQVNKATITVYPTGALSTTCNLVLQNVNIILNGSINVGGNLDLTTATAQANNITICGTGSMLIKGCAFAPNGQQNQILNNCTNAAKPTICAQLTPDPCSVPLTGSCNGIIINGKVVNGACKPLPVELIEFTADPVNRQGVSLRWATASEKNSKEFALERSADGKTFRSFRTVPGAGNKQSRTNYESVDDKPLTGTSYYRLRQADFDGATSYSPVRSVKMASSAGTMEVYPGHSAQEWVVSSTLPAEVVASKAAAVQVFDALGRVQKIECMADDSATGRWTLDLHTLPAGIYIVRLLTNSGSYSQRIAK